MTFAGKRVSGIIQKSRLERNTIKTKCNPISLNDIDILIYTYLILYAETI